MGPGHPETELEYLNKVHYGYGQVDLSPDKLDSESCGDDSGYATKLAITSVSSYPVQIVVILFGFFED